MRVPEFLRLSARTGEARRLKFALAALAGLANGACSISLPVLSLKGDDPETTAAAAGAPESLLSRELGPEDRLRAQEALAKALDPHGASSLVAWANPKSAMRGSFAPAGQPFLRRDEICRAFSAVLAGQAAPASLQGTACRPSGGEWAIKDLKAAKA